MSVEPEVAVPLPSHGGAPYCPACGYSCGCCCYDECQTPCPKLDEDGYCDCGELCHGGHEPWDCNDFSTRYRWAKTKSDSLAEQQRTAMASDKIDINVVIEQLVGKIAQLELEVAVLKAALGGVEAPIEGEPGVASAAGEAEHPATGGYV